MKAMISARFRVTVVTCFALLPAVQRVCGEENGFRPLFNGGDGTVQRLVDLCVQDNKSGDSYRTEKRPDLVSETQSSGSHARGHRIQDRTRMSTGDLRRDVAGN
jgi:hypothetical protein